MIHHPLIICSFICLEKNVSKLKFVSLYGTCLKAIFFSGDLIVGYQVHKIVYIKAFAITFVVMAV